MPPTDQAYRDEPIVPTPQSVADLLREHNGNAIHYMTILELAGHWNWLKAENAALKAQVEGHCERIAKQSELLSKRAESAWVPCSERLPEVYETVLMFVPEHTVNRVISGHLCPSQRWSDGFSFFPVTHWRPLPAPPEAKHAADPKPPSPSDYSVKPGCTQLMDEES